MRATMKAPGGKRTMTKMPKTVKGMERMARTKKAVPTARVVRDSVRER